MEGGAWQAGRQGGRELNLRALCAGRGAALPHTTTAPRTFDIVLTAQGPPFLGISATAAAASRRHVSCTVHLRDGGTQAQPQPTIQVVIAVI